jgi:hypothetical protein
LVSFCLDGSERVGSDAMFAGQQRCHLSPREWSEWGVGHHTGRTGTYLRLSVLARGGTGVPPTQLAGAGLI